MLKCVIVDDEALSRDELKFFLNEHDGFVIEKEFENPIDAEKYLEDNKVDVLFLDINMPELDGIHLGKIATKFQDNLKIIFITAYREYAADAFEIKAFDYILKPYSESRINTLLNNIISASARERDFSNTSRSQAPNKVTVTFDDKMFVISLDDIDYIEVSDKESNVFIGAKKYNSKFKISKWEEILPKPKFYRTHRAYIVNLDKISEIEPWFNGTYIIKIKDCPTNIPVSRGNIKEFKELLMIK